jgi:hypothetical protein
MQRYLPPLLVVLVLAGIAVRCGLEPSRVEAQEQIAGLVQGGIREEATIRLESYLERFDTEDDAWFAAWVWFRVGQPARALKQVWDHPTLPSRPDTARRFATTSIRAICWEDEARLNATGMEPFVLITLNERENAWARQRLREHARELELMGATAYFFPAYRRATSGPMRLIVEEFRKRDEEAFEVAAAIGSLGRGQYPAAADDEALLIKVVGDESWRRSYRDVWCVSALTLGRRGTPPCIAALEAAAKELNGSVNKLDQQDEQLLNIGLLAAGRFDLHDQIVPHVYSERPVMIVTLWYLEALIHRYLQGDMRSEVWLRRMWEGPGKRFGGLRNRMGRAFLLQDTLPSDEALKTWVGHMLKGLEDPKAPAMSHVVAGSFRLRSKLPGARDQLLELLGTLAQRVQPQQGTNAKLTRPFIEGLRALYLYD